MSKIRFKPLQQTWRDYIQNLLPCVACQSERSSHAGLCQDCWQQLPWALSEVYRHELHIQIACHYQYPLNQMILQYKYHQRLLYAPLFAQLILQLKLPKVQAIVAMPISDERLAERGFNQALEIAKIVAKAINIPVWQPIQRASAGRQKGLSRVERLQNIDEQFQVDKRITHKYRRVLVLDDVVTTGGSLHALCTVLRAIGCEQLHCVCVAGAV